MFHLQGQDFSIGLFLDSLIHPQTNPSQECTLRTRLPMACSATSRTLSTSIWTTNLHPVRLRVKQETSSQLLPWICTTQKHLPEITLIATSPRKMLIHLAKWPNSLKVIMTWLKAIRSRRCTWATAQVICTIQVWLCTNHLIAPFLTETESLAEITDTDSGLTRIRSHPTKSYSQMGFTTTASTDPCSPQARLTSTVNSDLPLETARLILSKCTSRVITRKLNWVLATQWLSR